jgi:cobalamin-dependent methionine synthase I
MSAASTASERTTVKQVLHTLRQQEAREEQNEYLAMSDFIAPKGSGVKDYIGIFAVTAGIGMDKLIAKYEADKDDYGKIMAQVCVSLSSLLALLVRNVQILTGVRQALGDRLAEAYAEKLHLDVRVKESMWGYSPAEGLSAEELIKVKYDGIRPAPGYPSQPDHTEKSAMWELLSAKDLASIELTESLAMLPGTQFTCFTPTKKGCHFTCVLVQKYKYWRLSSSLNLLLSLCCSGVGVGTLLRESGVQVLCGWQDSEGPGRGLCGAEEDGS